ncbi:hypothetical protein [Zavarzinella formosa]|uniref:hypothetical protein n=1 Tax=Zavarzinella formosa TaxID=360055 RepID=UPI00035CB26E|nr:hypothetical protein [Zavarzinella formosa]
MSDNNATDSLRRASVARMKHAIADAQQLVVILDKIKNGNAPIQEMANARGTVAKLCQFVHEASAYYSAFETVCDKKAAIPMGRPKIRKLSPSFVRKRWKASRNEGYSEGKC